MKTLVLSDAHLKVTPDGAETYQYLVSFLRQLDPSEYERIIFLGDLFDFWFEYRHVIFSGYFELLRSFADLTDAGVKLHLVCGNHDFWAGRFLEEHLKFSVHQVDFECIIGGKRVYFIHGDGIDPKDYSYRIYKRIARSSIVVRMFGMIHPDWAMALALRVSNLSRGTSERDERSARARDASESLETFAREKLTRGEADVVMCGHSHLPLRREFAVPGGTGLYFNTGDWTKHHTYVEWDGAAFELKEHREGQACSGSTDC